MLRLLSYNIRHGGVGREKEIAAVIRACDPDIVVLQEATHPRVVKTLADETGLEKWAATERFSLAFLSRMDIASHQWHLPAPMRRAYLEIRPASLDLTIFGVHLTATHSNLTERLRMRELRSLLRSIESQKDKFHVLTGDFNTLAPGELLEHRRLPPRLRITAWATGGRVRYKTIQIMLDAGYSDGFRMLRDDPGFTFPTWDPHVRLDFVFLPAIAANKLSSCRVMRNAHLATDASDHFPLLSEIEATTA
jgi:endonuclease/exonuclease/phosphatase family metal-dependent hydrolase